MVMALSLALGYSCAVIESSGPRRRRGPADWARWAVRPEASQFMTMAVAVLAMGAALTVSGSRSGIGAFAVAVAATGYFVARRVGKGRARRLVFAYLGCLLVGAILWAGVGATAGRFALVSTDAVSRIGAWRDTLRIIGDFPIVGTGVGSFARAMLVYQTGDREVFFAEAHNDYLQTIAEGGLLVAIPVIICLVALVRAARARVAAGQDSPIVFWLRAGAIAGLLGIAAQEMLDFSLQLPGVLVLFAVLAAIAVHRPPKAPEHARRV
jgi:O-antigen ligase